MKRFAYVIAIVAFVGPFTSNAFAQEDPEVTRMAKEHYKLGLEAYQAAKYDVAIKELKTAYFMKHIPALLINIAATYRKLGDNKEAANYYRKYLQEAPPDAKDRGEVEGMLKEVESGAPAAGTAPPTAPSAPKEGGEEAAPPPPPARFSHTTIDAAPPNQPIDVRVSMGVMKGVEVYAYYRQPGESQYKRVLMKRHGSEKVGRIPATAVTGTSLQYYIEARDSNDNVVRTAGTETSPNIVMIDPSAEPQIIASMDEQSEDRDREEREEEAPPPRKKPSRNLEEEEAPITGKLTEHKRPTVKKEGGPKKLGTVFWTGVGLAAGGAVLGAVMGGVGFANAAQLSDNVAGDTADNNGGVRFHWNSSQDPEKYYDDQGKMYDAIGIAGVVIGGALVVTGGAMMLADYMRVIHRDEPPPDERPRKRKKRRRPRYEEEEEEETSRPNWYVMPNAGPRQVGVGAGFSF